MGQYRTVRLTVTKSYIEYNRRRIDISQIVEVSQPQNNPTLIVTSVALIGVTACAIFSNYSSVWLLVLFSIAVVIGFAGFRPQMAVEIRKTDNSILYINLDKEKRPTAAIKTIVENVQEYKNKSRSTPIYVSRTNMGNSRLYPEEQVRQYVLQLLTNKFGYSQSDIESEFSIQTGRSQIRADVVVFYPGSQHIEENVFIII